MTEEGSTTRKLMERFNNAFEAHRPDQLVDLIGEGCVLENTGPDPTPPAGQSVGTADIT